MMLESCNKSLQLNLDDIQQKIICPINLRKISANVPQSQPSSANMLQAASSISTIFSKHGIKTSVKCFVSCLTFLCVHHSPYLVLLCAEWDRLGQAIWEGGNNFDESLDLWDSGHLCKLGVDSGWGVWVKLKFNWKKKWTYIHAGATTKGERVDICARRNHQYPSRTVKLNVSQNTFEADELISMTMWSKSRHFDDQKYMVQSRGPSRRLWLSATLSRAKAIAGPSPMAWLGPAQTGSAWPGFWLWAGPGTSLFPHP